MDDFSEYHGFEQTKPDGLLINLYTRNKKATIYKNTKTEIRL